MSNFVVLFPPLPALVIGQMRQAIVNQVGNPVWWGWFPNSMLITDPMDRPAEFWHGVLGPFLGAQPRVLLGVDPTDIAGQLQGGPAEWLAEHWQG